MDFVTFFIAGTAGAAAIALWWICIVRFGPCPQWQFLNLPQQLPLYCATEDIRIERAMLSNTFHDVRNTIMKRISYDKLEASMTISMTYGTSQL